MVVFLQSFKIHILHSFGSFDHEVNFISKDILKIKVNWQRPACSVSAWWFFGFIFAFSYYLLCQAWEQRAPHQEFFLRKIIIFNDGRKDRYPRMHPWMPESTVGLLWGALLQPVCHSAWIGVSLHKAYFHF